MLPQDDNGVIQKKNECQYCFRIFASRHGKSRHLKNCKVKKEKETKDKQIEIIRNENVQLKDNQNLTINNNTNITNNIISYLNVNYSNIQPMEDFIENFKNKFPLTEEDRMCLLNTYNECDIGLFSDTFYHMMKKYLIKQIDTDILPTIPMVCNDSNLRSFKEYHEDIGWKSTQSNKCIDQMIDISNSQIYEISNKMMCMNQKQRNKIYTRMKQENSLLSMESEKKEFELEKNFKIDKLDTMEEKCKYNIDNNVEQSEDESNKIKEMDFSIINDELIEKYSAPNAPKLIT